VDLSAVCQRRTAAYSSAGCQENPRQRGRQRGLGAGQYSLGKWITLLAKYSVISSSGKSVCSISLANTINAAELQKFVLLFADLLKEWEHDYS
jgi:hypothetical protein